MAQDGAGELEKKPSIRLSQGPCLGVKVKSKRPGGGVSSQARVSLEMCAEWLSRISLIAVLADRRHRESREFDELAAAVALPDKCRGPCR